EDDLVELAVALLLRPPPEMAAADQPGLVVVRAEVGGAGVRHLERDERDPGLAVLGGDDRRDVLVGLELDDEIDFLPHQDVRVSLQAWAGPRHYRRMFRRAQRATGSLAGQTYCCA